MELDFSKVQNGKYASYENDNWVTAIDENGVEYAVRPKDYEVRLAETLIEQSGISREFAKKTFVNFKVDDNYDLQRSKEKAQRYASGFRGIEDEKQNSIMFSGQPGSGKTHLGMAICKTLMNDGIGVIYMPYRDVVTMLKQTLTDKGAYQRQIERYKTARVLFIDDLLKGKTTEADINILYEIINFRYLKNSPMIISSEKTIKELLEFDEAIGSRILEMCKGRIVTFSGLELNRRLIP